MVLPHIHGFAIWQRDEGASSLVGPLAWGNDRMLLEKMVATRVPAPALRFLLDSALYFDLLGGCPDVVPKAA